MGPLPCVYWCMTDPRALRETTPEHFCNDHLAPLAAALTLYTGNADVGEELAQEALLRAVARWPQTRSLTAPRAWLYRVALRDGDGRRPPALRERGALARLPGDAGAARPAGTSRRPRGDARPWTMSS